MWVVPPTAAAPARFAGPDRAVAVPAAPGRGVRVSCAAARVSAEPEPALRGASPQSHTAELATVTLASGRRRWAESGSYWSRAESGDHDHHRRTREMGDASTRRLLGPAAAAPGGLLELLNLNRHGQ